MHPSRVLLRLWYVVFFTRRRSLCITRVRRRFVCESKRHPLLASCQLLWSIGFHFYSAFLRRLPFTSWWCSIGSNWVSVSCSRTLWRHDKLWGLNQQRSGGETTTTQPPENHQTSCLYPAAEKPNHQSLLDLCVVHPLCLRNVLKFFLCVCVEKELCCLTRAHVEGQFLMAKKTQPNYILQNMFRI